MPFVTSTAVIRMERTAQRAGAGLRSVASTLALALLVTTLGPAVSAAAAELTVDEGVVVKFGSGTSLVVRDKATLKDGAVFTTTADDSAAGQLGSVAGSPTVASWKGIRVEKSSATNGGFSASGANIRYAGQGGDAGLTLRGVSPALSYVQWSTNATGLRLLDAASPTIAGASFLKNSIGIEADGNSNPSIGSTQFIGNSAQAILNKTPATTIVARGNWWGNASGPQDPVANPQGLGDAVSTGVNYGAYLATAPLINPSIRVASPAPYYEQRTIALELSCLNATEYRIAEGDAFSGVVFQALPNGKINLNYNFDTEGRKTLNVQYRNTSGAIGIATVVNGILIDSAAPAVALTNPAPGSVISQPITVEASATDAAGITKVEFYLDGQLAITKTVPASGNLYTYLWNTDASAVGAHTVRVVAYDEAGRTSEQSRSVTISRTPPPADAEGPVLSALTSSGSAIVNGSTFTRNSAALVVNASDRSGVARVDFLLGSQSLVTASNNGNGNYSANLDLTSTPNGTATLTVRAVDSLSNISSISYSITIAHAVPDAPVITTPAAGLVTRNATLAIAGTAQPGSTVQLIINSANAGTPTVAATDGRFSANITLSAGNNNLQARASDAYGVSALSGAVTVNLDVTVPASPSNLIAQAQTAGKVRLTWTRSSDANVAGYHLYRASNAFADIAQASKVNSSLLNAQTNSFDDLPPADGIWYYRVVAVNSAGTPSVPTDLAQAAADNTLPKAMSIAYTPLGKVDIATGRIGQGRVNVALTTNEALQAVPYLAVVPAGGSPIAVDLSKTSNTTYAGSFVIDVTTPSGTANVLFSARDIVGNRGTDIDTGATLKIDTDGPVVVGLALNPSAPIKNDPAATVQATLTLSKPVKASGTPALAYTLSTPGRQPIAVTGMTQLSPTSWRASFTLPADAGQVGPETLVFSFQALDDLDNLSNKITAFNRFQVYQGNLPPLDVPLGLTGKAIPGGKVNLNWLPVDNAFAYQIYRQSPSQTSLQAWQRASASSFVDETTQDGTYKYAVATVRQSNSQESISGQSASIDITASATAPGAPQNMTLQLTGQGIVVRWQAPLASTIASYNVYRAAGTSITSINGLTPYKTGVKNIYSVDPTPSPVFGAYAVTALDAAGNESAASNSNYLNASLLPVSNLRIEQADTSLPTLSWNAPNGNVAGYNVYVGSDSAKVKLTATPLSVTNFIDTGYSSGERRYTVATVDANGVELGRTLLLPNITSQIVSGLPIKRGVMNKLQVQVTNTSATTQDGVTAGVRVPNNRDSTQFRDHRSESFSLAPNQTKLATVIVGGYTDMPGQPLAQLSVEVAPNEGELVKLSRQQRVDVVDSALVVGMTTEDFVRGATGKVRLAIENTSDVEVELLTALNGGVNDSNELRFKLLDGDGNVLATQPYKQAIGSRVITLTNGQTVARIPAGASYTSDLFSINVPASAPNILRVKLEVDTLRYHSGQADQVIIAGRGSEKSVSLADTAYVGEVSNITPISSFGEQDIVITGRALDRRTNAPLPSTRLKLILNQQGFERVFGVLTDASGIFTYTFKPTATDAGLYKVSAVHPDITDRPEQKAFTINRVAVGPNPYKLDVPKNYPYTIPLLVNAGPGTSGTNLRLVLEASAQPTGQVPAGISVQLPSAINIVERQTLNLPVVFTANNDAQLSGSLIFNLYSDQRPQGAGDPLGQVRVNYTLSEARPNLVSSPSYIETGMALGGNQLETLAVQNNGLQDALNLQFTLTKSDGTPAPAWVAITSSPNGDLAVGQRKSVDVSFTPGANVVEGIYEFRIKVQGDNVPAQSLNVYASITQSGQGNVLFRASDIYTATLNKQGQLIQGLGGAAITLQNEDVPTVKFNLTSDSVGEAFFQNVPAGRYQWRATAANHQERAGRLVVKPGITGTEPIFLDYNLINVEWSVREITVNDRYEITIDATFETDVPAAVVVMQPASINLPKMKPGDVTYGEITLANYGLIRADNVKQKLPPNDAYFRYEFLGTLPDKLEAKQRVTIPYRIVALQSLDPDGQASGGGCYSYGSVVETTCTYICKNGVQSICSAKTSFFSVGGSCSTGGTGGGFSFGGGGGTGGGSGGGIFGGGSATTSTPIKLKGKKCVALPDGKNSCGGN
jgi:large repetitive protein